MLSPLRPSSGWSRLANHNPLAPQNGGLLNDRTGCAMYIFIEVKIAPLRLLDASYVIIGGTSWPCLTRKVHLGDPFVLVPVRHSIF